MKEFSALGCFILNFEYSILWDIHNIYISPII